MKQITKLDIQYAMRLPAPQRYKMLHAIIKRVETTAERTKKVIKKKHIGPKHQFIKELLDLGLNPRQVASLQVKHVNFNQNVIAIDKKILPLSENLKQKFKTNCDFTTRYLLQTNRHKKYTTRTIQEIAKFRLC